MIACPAERVDAFHPAWQNLVSCHRETIQLTELFNTRAISADTVKEFGVGLIEEAGSRWWVFPIRHGDDSFMVQKRHAARSQGLKNQWVPKGAKSGKVLFPVFLEGEGPVWLCPGELKALAAADLGLPGIGWTSGEADTKVSDDLLNLLADRSVAIVPDNDETGVRWAQEIAKQLTAKGIETRIVDLSPTNPGEDLGDPQAVSKLTGRLKRRVVLD